VEALMAAGFVVASVRTLYKQQRSYRQVTANTATKQDLVISAYKPTAVFEQRFHSPAGSESAAWRRRDYAVTPALRAPRLPKPGRRQGASVVAVAQRLPERVVQEDADLLMYYDNALIRSATE
jgi:hypothetical protein